MDSEHSSQKKHQLLLTCQWIFRYLFGDLYAHAIWAGTENPENSGNFTMSQIPFSCAHDSPIQCSSVPGSSLPALGYIFSFGEDNNKDIFLLTSSGVYRVVRPSRCNYTCSKENATATASPSPAPSSPSSQVSWLNHPCKIFLLLFPSLSFLVLFSVQHVVMSTTQNEGFVSIT